MIPDDELLKMACEFRVGLEPLVLGRPLWWYFYPHDVNRHTVRVRNTGNREPDVSEKWAILGCFGCLNKQGEWEYQPLPSSRPDDFYERCRYDSVHEAIQYFRHWSQAITEFALSKYAAIGLTVTPDMPLEDYQRVVVNYQEIPPELLRF